MAKICIIDDDFSIENLVEYLARDGHEVERYSTAEQALENLDKVAEYDLIILDVMMEPPLSISVSASHGGHRTGLIIAQELRKRHQSLPIIAFSATSDKDVVEWFQSSESTYFISKMLQPSMSAVSQNINKLLGTSTELVRPQSFIVHGHNDVRKFELKNYLQNTLGFPEPTILHEQCSQGKTIMEKFEYYGAKAELIFVLLTPDDKVVSDNDKPNEEKRRARQNVIFELGYFLGLLGRHSGQVLLLHEGAIELPSDILGLIYIDISDGIEAAGEKIRQEVNHVIKA